MNIKHEIINKIKWLFSFIYFNQIKMKIPKETFAACKNSQFLLSEGYSLCSPSEDVNLEEWAGLLNSDGGFGFWTPELIRSEILGKMILPDAASLLMYNKKIVGCTATYKIPSRRKTIGMIMWVMIDKEHRGKHLSYPLFFRTLNYFNCKEYDNVIITSDSYRYVALHFYFRIGAKPLYDSFFGFFQWWKTKRHMQKLFDRKDAYAFVASDGVSELRTI